jgi:hypothetical protein
MKFDDKSSRSSMCDRLGRFLVFSLFFAGLTINGIPMAFSAENEIDHEQEATLNDVSEAQTIDEGLASERNEKAAFNPALRNRNTLTTPSNPSHGNTHACSLALSENKLMVEPEGGQRTIQVAVAGPCDWDLPADDTPWLEITKDLGTNGGSGTITCSVLPNETPFPRIAVLTVASRVITVIQSGAGTSYAANY